MKKIFWWILIILLSPVLLFVVLTVLLYLPPVQNWAVDKVTAIASEKTGMDISVDRVNLSFPLDLSIDHFRVLQNPDTLADVERMVVDVQLLPLLDSKVVINELEVTNTSLNTLDLVAVARVKGRFSRLFMASKGIDLDQGTVELNGSRLEDAFFDIQMADSIPEDTTTSEPVLWKIYVDSVTIDRSDVVFHMPGDTMSVNAHLGSLVAREALIDLGTQTYTVGSVDWVHGAVKYDQNYQPRIDGLDYNHIDLSDITVGIDSIYYHDPTLRMYLRQVALKEKSGLAVTHLSGPIAMEDGAVKLPKFRLSTPYSDIDVELDMPLSLMEPVDPGKMRLRMNASLGKQDLMPFMADLPAAMRQRWPEYPLTVSGLLKGNMQHMDFHDLEVSLPTAFHANATGFAANLDKPDMLRADVQFTATTQNLGFVMAMMPRDMQRDYRIPPLSAQGRVKADGQQYFADITAREGRGTVKAKGSFNAAAMRYDADIKVRDLNVHHFMPHDSIYTVSADVTAKGQGTDFFSPRTTLVAAATIHHVGYGKLNIDNITAHALVSDGKAHANLVSRNPLLKGAVNFDALLSTTRFDGTLSTDFQELNLYEMGVTPDPLTIGLCGHFDINSDLKLTHYATGLINDLSIKDSSHVYRPSDIDLLLNTTSDTTFARAQSGDFIVKLDASGNYEQLLDQFLLLGDSAMAQLDRKTIDQPALRRLLPTMRMTLQSQRENPVATFLKASADIDFKDMLFDVSTSVAEGVNGRGYIHSLTVSELRLDTINFTLTQRKERLSFGGQVRNNKKNPQFVFNALFDGIIQERGATLGVRYFDADNKLGARIGAQAEVVDSGLSLHLVPERPTLGYKEFALNKDNFLFLGASGKVKAKVDLRADDGMGIRLYSEDTNPDALQDLTLSLHQFNLEEITSVIPYAPRMSGMLNGDYHVVQDAGGQFSVAGDMGVRNMTYERCPIGNISTEMVYLQKENDAHAIEARLMMDDDEIGLLTGTYFNEGEGSLDATLQLEHLPLNIVNGFVPDQICGLQGYGEGELTIQGPLSRPEVNGEVYLSNSYMESVPYGVKLRFDDDPVRIQHSNLLFENFTVYAHNDNPLNVQGNVNFSNLEKIMVNLRMQANNFQIIGTKEHAKSVAYGKAFVNVFAMMNGPLENLNMRGRLDVLGTTDMGYILRDTPITTDNQLDDLVKFTDFSDTTQIAVTRPPINGFSMDMTLNVSKGAHIMAYMNADHSNYIDLMGGGTLRMLYSPADNLQMTGRYTLSNGEMKYALPIIPLKTFHIQDGSYIEFTGDPMNPTLNISAVEHTKATVTGTTGVGRSVAFDCGVNITRTLNDMGLEFTLDAPEDMQLHSELQAMGVEQRGKLAVTMLTTGMYLADGNTKPFSMNSALSSFLSSEISNLTGNALRTLDLSFGMDNTTDATGQSRTDYSFKFAKRFLNNRLKLAVGGKVTTGQEMPGGRNNSFFDNVSLEYRLDDTANKYLNLFFENNSYDWLDGYTQKYGGGFIWRRTLQNFTDIFRLKDDSNTLTLPPVRTDSTKTTRNDKK
ncbi:MAG: translocation/assembly module TamB domain-containing protein [Prevotella sp.]|nr:translocation/assembly module TamB domain-containing protein [Prevotella sp.]